VIKIPSTILMSSRSKTVAAAARGESLMGKLLHNVNGAQAEIKNRSGRREILVISANYLNIIRFCGELMTFAQFAARESSSPLARPGLDEQIGLRQSKRQTHDSNSIINCCIPRRACETLRSLRVFPPPRALSFHLMLRFFFYKL
jgi:hypothetical protein